MNVEMMVAWQWAKEQLKSVLTLCVRTYSSSPGVLVAQWL